jgi:hypothetical protein
MTVLGDLILIKNKESIQNMNFKGLSGIELLYSRSTALLYSMYCTYSRVFVAVEEAMGRGSQQGEAWSTSSSGVSPDVLRFFITGLALLLSFDYKNIVPLV